MIKKTFISLGIFLVLCLPYSAFAISQVEISDGSVVTLYHMNGNLNDSSGNGWNGTGNGTGFYSSSSFMNGNAVSMNTTGIFTAASSSFPMDDSAWSIGFWAYLTTGGSTFGFINKTNGSNQEGISDNLWCVNGDEAFYFNGTTHCYADLVGQHLAGQTWTWILFTHFGTTYQMYVNDVLKATATNATPPGQINSSVQFNGEVGDANNRGVWAMDEYFFTNSAINTSTRDSLYNSGNGAQICITVGCANPVNPSISLSTSTYPNFTTTFTSSTEIIQNAGASGATTLNWSATTTLAWLSFSASSGALAQNATTSINLISAGWGYAPGTYNGTATISDANATNSPQTINVSLFVQAAGGGGTGGTRSFWWFQ